MIAAKGLANDTDSLKKLEALGDYPGDTLDSEWLIYYILDENDWQTPSVLAQAYFQRINAPFKNSI